MTEQEALTKAKKIWGPRAKVMKTKYLCLVGLKSNKHSWVKGQGPTWEEAFIDFYRCLVQQEENMVATGFKFPNNHDDVLGILAERKEALNKGQVPER